MYRCCYLFPEGLYISIAFHRANCDTCPFITPAWFSIRVFTGVFRGLLNHPLDELPPGAGAPSPVPYLVLSFATGFFQVPVSSNLRVQQVSYHRAAQWLGRFLLGVVSRWLCGAPANGLYCGTIRRKLSYVRIAPSVPGRGLATRIN